MEDKRVSMILALSILVLAGLGFWFYHSFAIFSGPTVDVVVGPKWLNQAQFAGMFSAQEEGIYERNGINAVFKEFDFETEQINDLLTGETDFALISAEEMLLAASEALPITAIAAVYQVSPYSIVSLSESAIKTPADFDGKILGNKGGKTEEELFYLLLLETVGLNQNDVFIRDLGFDQREIDDLLTKKSETVGLYRTDQLYHFEQEEVSYNIIHPEQYGVDIYNDILVTRSSLIQSNPELVKRFVQATVKGWQFAQRNIDAAVEHTMKYVTNESYKDESYQRFILEQSLPLIQPDEGRSIGTMSVNQWTKLFDSLWSRGFLKEEFDVSMIFTNEFIK